MTESYLVHRKQLAEATAVLLNQSTSNIHIMQAITSLHDIFATITGVKGAVYDAQHDEDSWLPNGLAVSPFIAAQCLVELFRTTQFLRGIETGIQEALRRFAQRPLRILYAGCGPYATLLLPMTTRFTADEIQISLLDIHEPSITAVQKLAMAVGAEKHIADYITADATSYQHPTSLHLIVLEMLQGALKAESQVAATLNLLPQLGQNGILIPQNVTVDACITAKQRENFGILQRRDSDGFPLDLTKLEQQRIYLGRLLELNAVTSQDWQKQASSTIIMPPCPPEENQFMLETAVTIFDNICIHGYQSEVSHPVILSDLGTAPAGTQIQFKYQLGSKPGFTWETSHPNGALVTL